MPQSTLDQLIATLFAIQRLVLENLRRGAKLDPASFVQLEALRLIKEAGKPTMREVAHHLHITPPSATSLIDALVKTQNLARAPDPHDRRIIRLALTTKGERVLARGLERKRNGMKQIFSSLNEEEQRQLTQIIKKILHTHIHEK